MTGPWAAPARHPCSFAAAGRVCDRESIRLWWRNAAGSIYSTARLPKLPRGMTGYRTERPDGTPATEGFFRCELHPLDKDPA